MSDDSDTDAIGALVHARAGRADIRYVKNPVRLKTRANYEQCMQLASGEYIKFLNDDDVLEAECVATLVDAFVRVPGLTLATSTRRRIDGNSRPLPDMPATRPAVDRDLVVGGVSLANATIMHGLNFIGEPSTALIRKRDFALRPDIDDDHRFSFNGEEVRGAVDFAMWSRVLVQGNAAFFARRLSRFRSHGEQAQANAEVVQRSIVGIRALQRHWIELACSGAGRRICCGGRRASSGRRGVSRRCCRTVARHRSRRGGDRMARHEASRLSRSGQPVLRPTIAQPPITPWPHLCPHAASS